MLGNRQFQGAGCLTAMVNEPRLGFFFCFEPALGQVLEALLHLGVEEQRVLLHEGVE